MMAVKRCSLYANQSTNQIRVEIKGSEVIITAEDMDFSNKSKEKLACSYTGEEMIIGFNAKFFNEMLSYMESDNIKIEMSTPNRAVLLTQDKSDENEDVLMMIMPITTR